MYHCTIELMDILCLYASKTYFIIRRLIQPWPNTYAFTKAIAEDVVRTKGKDIPTTLVRPAIGNKKFLKRKLQKNMTDLNCN